MTKPPFTVKALDKENRSGFACGKPEIDRYFHTQISQDVRRRLATAFICVHTDTGRIAGFYTLSAAIVRFGDLDDSLRKKLPRYPNLPAVLVGRLGVDQNFKGERLGSALLADAAVRTIKSDIAAHFMLVDALDEDAARFYQHHGFQRVPDDERRLFIPLSVLQQLI